MSGIKLNAHTPVNLLTPVRPSDITPTQPMHSAVEPAAETQQTGTPTSDNSTSIQMQHRSIQASFDYDESLKQIIITLRREETGEVLQQFPPEKIRNLLTQIMHSMGNTLDRMG